MDSWNPQQYHRYADERLRPAGDLLSRVPLDDPRLVYDLGCGSGRATALLARRWPGARITGLDSSAAMLAVARRDLPGVELVEGDVAHWTPAEPASLLFSNAALHWLDDHARLFARLMTLLAPGGVLAVQMPRNHDQPSHQAMLATAGSGPWRERLARLLRPSPVSLPATYHALLRPLARRLDIWETTYLHVLHGPDAVLRWIRGTGLRPFLAALEQSGSPNAVDDFLASYAAALRAAYPRDPHGRVVFPFRRIFAVSVAPDPGGGLNPWGRV